MLCFIPLSFGIRIEFQYLKIGLLLPCLTGKLVIRKQFFSISTNAVTKVAIDNIFLYSQYEILCVLLTYQGWFSPASVNEEMVLQGVAVTCHVSTLTNNPLYHKLQRRLLKAELHAEKKGVGIWLRPSLLERLQNRVLRPFSKVKRAFNTVRYLSLGSIFSRKSGKDDE